MPNMQDAQPTNSFLLVGPAGSGKTFQFRTLPGKKFAWVFDPNARAALAGLDIEYIDLVPDIGGKSAGASAVDILKTGAETSVAVWKRFRADFRERLVSGYFDTVDSVLLDGLTGLVKVCEEFVLAEHLKRPAGILEGREYQFLTREVSDALRDIASLGKNFLACAHRNTIYDQAGLKTTGVEIGVPGKLRQVVPIYFANIMFSVAESTSTTTKYSAWIRQNAIIGDARMADCFSGLDAKIDMTVTDRSRPETFGLGKLLTLSKQNA